MSNFDKSPMSQEEKIIANLETNLPFSQKHCRDLVNTFRLNSTSGSLSTSQLSRAYNDLAWTEFGKTSKNAGLNIVISAISKDSRVSVMQLCFLSVLLGRDSAKTKAEILFSLMDPEASGSVSVDKVETALGLLLNISIEVLPQIAVENEILTKDGVNHFIKKLKRKEKSFISKFSKRIMNEREGLLQDEFVNQVCEEKKKLNDITCSRGIRSILLDGSLQDDAYTLVIQSQLLTSIATGSVQVPNETIENLLEEIDSPLFNFSSSDEESLELLPSPKRKEDSRKDSPKINKKSNIHAKKPPRPCRSHESLEVPSPDTSVIASPSPTPRPREKELWKNSGGKKILRPVRCSSLSGRGEERVLLKYKLFDKVVEIEMKQWEDPIRIAHNFAVKNKLSKRERSKIAVLLMKLQKKN